MVASKSNYKEGMWGGRDYIDFYYFILHHLQFHLQQEQLLCNLHTKKGTEGYFSECCKQLNWNIVNLSYMVSRKSLFIYLVLKWVCTVRDRMAILLERY